VDVRRATPDDVPWLVAELREFAAHYPVTNVSLFGSDEYAAALLSTLITDQFVAIAHRGEVRCGLIAGAVGPHPYNPDLLVASELWWFVSPAHRGSSAGYSLFLAFHAWARDVGADLATMTLASNSAVNTAAFERFGYRETERAYTFAFAETAVPA
jgi:GNAT superfamily N-acetyltransferase